MTQPPVNKNHRTIRIFAVVTVTAAAASVCTLNTGCSMRGQKLPLWPQQASANAARAETLSTGVAEGPTAKAGAQAMLEHHEPIALASFDRPGEGNAAQTPYRSAAAPAAEPTAAYPTAPVAGGPPPVSSAIPVSRSQIQATRPPAGEVLTANSATFDELVVHSEVPVLVDFYADWCGPCRALSPKLHELAQEVADVRVVKVNIDESPDIAARYQVRSIPALRVFDHGKVTARHRGLTNKKHLKTLIGR
jgi:thioredoxin 1